MLADAIVAEAKEAGYQRMRLDTISTMEPAIALYESMGFKPILPYRANPIPGAMYFELLLEKWVEQS